FNIEHVREAVLNKVASEPVRPRLVLCDLSTSPHVDLQSAHTLAGLARDLEGKGVGVEGVEAGSAVRGRLRAGGGGEKLGGIDRFRTVAQVVEDFERGEGRGRVRLAT